MVEKMNVCRTCVYWVDCKTRGFCLNMDLFTYTAKRRCESHLEGKPVTEKEWEESNNPKNWFSEREKYVGSETV